MQQLMQNEKALQTRFNPSYLFELVELLDPYAMEVVVLQAALSKCTRADLL